MHKYAMVVTYDGSNYGGWQIQPNSVSIQSLIERALFTILRNYISVIGSSRTDAGVHALGQVAHFETEEEVSPYKLIHGLNGILPRDIRILRIYPVEEDFHSRYNAKKKIYHYHLHLDPVLDPFTRLYKWDVPHGVNLALLKEAIPPLIGTKDFTAFSNQSRTGAAAKNAVRTLDRIDVVEEPGGVRLEFEGNGFLYKMVRNITGTLLDVSRQHIAPSEIASILTSKDRRNAGKSAPPQGLFLVKVQYEESSVSKEEK